MNPEYFLYFKQFFAIIWSFLQAPVPVLGLPWIALLGGPFIITVLLGSLNHVLGFSVPSIGDVYADALNSKDKVTDRKKASADAKGTKDTVNKKKGVSYYAHIKTYRLGGDKK